MIKGQETHKKPLEKNLVQFWSRDNKDGRLICDYCLTQWEIVRELEIEKKIVSYWLGQGFSKCEVCDKKLEAAGHTGKVKNRNNTAFWGLQVPEKVSCLVCVEKNYSQAISS